MRNFLNKRIEIQVWKLILVMMIILLVLYISWEVFWFFRVGKDAIKWHTYVVVIAVAGYMMLLPLPQIARMRKKIFLGVMYLLLSLAIGEFHPFTQVPMYNKFESKIIVADVTDLKGKHIPFRGNFNLSSGELMHRYSILREQLHAQKPNITDKELSERIGKMLFEELMATKRKNFDPDSVMLNFRLYSMTEDSIVSSIKSTYAPGISQ